MSEKELLRPLTAAKGYLELNEGLKLLTLDHPDLKPLWDEIEGIY